MSELRKSPPSTTARACAVTLYLTQFASGSVDSVGRLLLPVIEATCLFLIFYSPTSSLLTHCGQHEPNTVEPGHNDIDLSDISPTASDILWFQSIPHC